MKNFLFVVFVILIFSSCSNEEQEMALQSQINSLEKNLESLEKELDQCRNGAPKLLAKSELAFEEQNLNAIEENITELKKRHPESEELQSAIALKEELQKVIQNQKEEAARKAEQARQERLKSLNKLRKEVDDISRTTWYKNPFFTHYSNTYLTSIYIGQSIGAEWMRLRMSYTGSDWIFFERAYLSYEGKTIEIDFDEYDEKETDSGYGGKVWEWIDVPLKREQIDFMKSFSESKDAKMRFVGKYTKTRSLTLNERRGIKLVLDGYEALRKE